MKYNPSDSEHRQMWLDALEAAGVDNWEGYEEALRILKVWLEEEKETQNETVQNHIS